MAGLPVKGTCPKCKREHSTEADKGKVTWRGTCPKPGCDGRIIARRIREDKPTDKPESDPPASEPDDRPSPRRRARKVVKVDGYAVKDVKGRERDPDVSGTGTGADGESESGPAESPGAGTAPDSSGGETPSAGKQRRFGRKSSRTVPQEGKRRSVLGGYGDLY
jgi:hypothetical protein